MGVYDFFKGKCPNCPKNIDEHPEFGACGDIQTKYFIMNDEECFRNFYPSHKVPFDPYQNFIIGRTCCCKTIIKACFVKNLLVEYVVVSGKEKYLYIKKELQNSFERQYVPTDDRYWHDHVQNFRIHEMEKNIISSAMHPHKIEYYIDIGYTLDEVCV